MTQCRSKFYVAHLPHLSVDIVVNDQNRNELNHFSLTNSEANATKHLSREGR